MNTNQLEIIAYNERLAVNFKQLNEAWLQKYFEIEPIDVEMLSNPTQYFIDKSGHIFFANLAGEIVGTFALLKESDSVYELSKMAVAESFQGKNIGNKLMEFAIAKATELNAIKIILYSNTRLAPAIHLYRKYGFVEVPIISSDYKRCNIKMELIIQ
jgi:ribosomal protein S18 acetylase RimI-like enzyme